MTNVFRMGVTVLCLLCSTTAACTPSMSQMKDRFQEEMVYAVGLTLAQVTDGEFEVIGKRKPTDTTRLPNGNTLYVYGNYWVQYEINRTPCDVYLEVNPETNVVVNAYSKGDGCFMPY